VIDMTEAVREAVRDLADEGRAVDLGEKAVTAVRRRTGRTRVVGTAMVALAVAAVLVWPEWIARTDSPAGSAPTAVPAPSMSAPLWPEFTGLHAVPAAPAGAASDRLVMAAYTTHPETSPVDPATVATFLLNPTSGRYERADVDVAHAFSPDLRFALVARHHQVPNPDGANFGDITEFGVYDTVVGRIVGRFDLDRWAAPPSERFVWNGFWSPDGRSIVLEIRLGIHGRGWLADRAVFVDVLTGALTGVDLAPAQGFEPQEMLGWTADSKRIALTADQVGTDQAPSAHTVYDQTGRPVSVHPWPQQSNPRRAVNADQLLLMPMDPGEAVVMDLSTGDIEHRYPTEPISSLPSWGYPLGWRDGTLIYREQICIADTCTDGREVLGVTPATGQSRKLYTVPEETRHIVLAPAGALTGAAASLTW
jgi:hypothetical protein